MEKQKARQRSPLIVCGLIGLLISAILLISRMFVYPYDTGDLTRAYPYWCAYLDVTDDLSYIAINDNAEMIYCIDYEQEAVQYILDSRDFPLDYPNLADLSFDAEGNLYVYVTEQNENYFGDLSDWIYRFDQNGNLIEEYLVSDLPGSKGFKMRFGMKVQEDYISYVEETETDYSIIHLDLETGDIQQIASFSFQPYCKCPVGWGRIPDCTE